MSVVRLHDRPIAHPTASQRRAPVGPSGAVQAIAVAGALVLGVVLALMLPGTARGADPAPNGAPDSYDAPHSGPLVVGTDDGVLANDVGSGLTVELWTDADHGEVVLAPDGSFSYTPTEVATT